MPTASTAHSSARRAPRSPTRNTVRLLLDAEENFPAWLDAIRGARSYVLFEMYIIADDRVGRAFMEALTQKAREGVHVCVVYDWLGSTKFGRPWDSLQAAGADVRCFNPPSLDSPLAWLTRDHRKSIVVDGEVGFVSGLCVSAQWEGDPAKRLEPWRDTGVEIRGDAVVDLETAFAPGVVGLRRRAAAPRAFERGHRARSRQRTRDRGTAERRRHVSHRPAGRVDGAQDAVAHRCVLRRDGRLHAGAARGRARRRRRAPAGAGRERHPGDLAAVALGISRPPRSGRARVRVERHDAAREDRGCGRHVVARRLDEPQRRELAVELRTRRRDRGCGVRAQDGGAVREGPGARHRDRAHGPESRAAQRAAHGRRSGGGACACGARYRAAPDARRRVPSASAARSVPR